MPTKSSIMNEALRILGEPPINDPADKNERARQLSAAWEPSVLTAIEQGAWEWGTTRATLAQSAIVPDWGRAFYYVLPADCARVVFVTATGLEHDDLQSWDAEDGMIATDEPVIYIKYITKSAIHLPGKWGQGFADFVAAELAFRTAPKLAPSKLGDAGKVLTLRRKVALSSDAVNQPPQLRKLGSLAMAHRNRFTRSWYGS